MKSRKLIIPALAILLIGLSPVANAESETDASNSQCNNNGFFTQITVIGDNSYDCTAMVMYCDMGTGAGAGGGAGGPGQNDVGVEAGATGRCHQEPADPEDAEQCTTTYMDGVDLMSQNKCAPSAASVAGNPSGQS